MNDIDDDIGLADAQREAWLAFVLQYPSLNTKWVKIVFNRAFMDGFDAGGKVMSDNCIAMMRKDAGES